MGASLSVRGGSGPPALDKQGGSSSSTLRSRAPASDVLQVQSSSLGRGQHRPLALSSSLKRLGQSFSSIFKPETSSKKSSLKRSGPQVMCFSQGLKLDVVRELCKSLPSSHESGPSSEQTTSKSMVGTVVGLRLHPPKSNKKSLNKKLDSQIIEIRKQYNQKPE